MDSDGVKWIKIFDITDTNKHEKGFMIFKVTSMLYPEKCPDAVTKLTVWKRYNDFKQLWKEMKVLHGKHNIKERFPLLPRGRFFKKYNKQALREKKENALNLLHYLGNHHQLFTSKEFVKFFETSYTPADHLNGNITSIRADLNLPDDPEFVRSSDDDQMFSDTDSISTVSSISHRTDLLDVSMSSTSSGQSTLRLSLKSPEVLDNLDNISTCTIESLTLLDGQIYCSLPRTPDCDEPYVQYIIDASVHIKLAEELEKSRKYEESFVAYKTAIDILLRHGATEENYDRKRLVKYKTEKYLVRAEKLYNMYLAPEMRHLQTIFEQTKEKTDEPKPAMSDLYKYNVIRTIDSGMLVVHSDTQKIFYVKVIHKTTKFLDDNLVLPENVPFMVQLYNYYNCDNALFLVLEYVNGLKLPDYVQKIRKSTEENCMIDDIFDKVTNSEISDDESDKSFSDLINDYARRKETELKSSDESFEIITKEHLLPDHSKDIISQPIGEVGSRLHNFATVGAVNEVLSTSSHRKSSTMSSFDIGIEHSGVPDSEIIKWMAQLILALEKLHILGIVCRNLRSRNLIIDKNGDLIVTFMCNVQELCDVFNNTSDLSLAPEIYGIGPIGKEADWWSMGAILYEILVGMTLNDVNPQIFKSGSVLKLPKYVSPEGRSLLRQLLIYEPKDRLGAGPHGIDNLKSHPFFRGVDWNALLDRWRNR